MQKSAKGQITLVSLSDGSSAVFFVSVNESTQQLHNNETGVFVPDYSKSATNLVLTPKLTVGGIVPQNVTFTWSEAGNDIKNLQYSVNDSGVMTITSNLQSEQKLLTCKASYDDPNTSNPVETETTVVLSKTETAGTNVNVLLDPVGVNYIDSRKTEGDDADGSIEVCTLKATTYYGTDIVNNDQSNRAIRYSWGIYNFHNNMFTGFSDVDMVSTGVVDTASPSLYNGVVYYKKLDTPILVGGDKKIQVDFTTSGASSLDYDIKIVNDTIEVKANAVDVKETIKCEVIVYNVSGSTVDVTLGSDSDIETITDRTDEYTVGILATSTALTAAAPVAKLTAVLYQRGVLAMTSKFKNLSYDWDAFQVSTSSGESTGQWPEYELVTDASGNKVAYRRMESGEIENGTGHWLSGVDHPEENGRIQYSKDIKASFTGNREVTVYRDQVGNNSQVSVTVYL